MTDKEIIKALGLCFNINHNAGLNCGECPYKKDKCSLALYNDIIDLINRQQAEIDRLKAEHEKTTVYCANLFDKYEKTKIAKESLENTRYTARAEAIKEFAEKLKAEHSTPDILMPFNWISIEDTALDQLVAEMVGAEE